MRSLCHTRIGSMVAVAPAIHMLRLAVQSRHCSGESFRKIPIGLMSQRHGKRGPVVAANNSSTSNEHNMKTSPQPLRLDPPFSPVEGEQVSSSAESGHRELLRYVCRSCSTPLFSEADLQPGTAPGSHTSGWPTFTAPLTDSTLKMRTISQRAATASSQPFGSKRITHLDVSGLVPACSMSYRGLAVEGDVVRNSGKSIVKPKVASWREMCLRDPNQRSDAVLLEGCCKGCGQSVCRVIMKGRSPMRYVSTASLVRAVSE